MRRGLLLGLIGLLLLGGATLGARWWAGEEITRQLNHRDATWSRRTEAFTRIELEDVTVPSLPGVRVDLGTVDLMERRMRLFGVHVDARALLGTTLAAATGDAGGSGPSSSTAADVPVLAEGLTVAWGDTVLATDLSGTLRPAVALEGDGARLTVQDGRSHLLLTRPLPLTWLTGLATAELDCTGRDCRAELTVEEAVLEHPLLAPGPLPAHRLRLQLATDASAGPDAHFSGTVQLGLVRGSVQVRVAGSAVEVDLHTDDLAIEDVVDLFGPLVPEAPGAILGGTLGLDASYRWPDGTWSATPRADRLQAEGVLPPTDLRGGPFAWTAPTASGETALRRSGDGVPGWVPLRDAGLFPDAVIAAEDSAFSRHRGYDLAAMQAALDRMAEEPEGLLRGGSTLTQQLAKNLFLDRDDRTLARKLRELLLALELETTLPKRRILELYVNVVELGPGLIGVEEASDAYFLKRPARLTPREAAFLASVLPAPRTRGGRAWRTGRAPDARISAILQNMANGGALSQDAAAAAQRAPLRFVPR